MKHAMIILGMTLAIATTANAASNCATPYSDKLSDDQIISLEQSGIQQRLLRINRVVTFKSCSSVVKDQVDANQSRSRANEYGLRQTVQGIQKTSVYACEGLSPDGEFTGYFKLKRFEAIAAPEDDTFAMYQGCEEFKPGVAKSVTVDYSVVNKK